MENCRADDTRARLKPFVSCRELSGKVRMMGRYGAAGRGFPDGEADYDSIRLQTERSRRRVVSMTV